jgi:nucleotide-binding universal stress UspA family protein
MASAGDRPGHVLGVLLAFDGSPASWTALDAAIALAECERARLTINGVVREPPWLVDLPLVTTCWTRADLRRDAETELQRLLALAVDRVPATVSVTTRVLRGKPARVLAALESSGQYDVLVDGLRRSRTSPSIACPGSGSARPSIGGRRVSMFSRT